MSKSDKRQNVEAFECGEIYESESSREITTTRTFILGCVLATLVPVAIVTTAKSIEGIIRPEYSEGTLTLPPPDVELSGVIIHNPTSPIPMPTFTASTPQKS